jgi:hypothetical protein
MFVQRDGDRIRPTKLGEAFAAHVARAGLPRIALRKQEVRHGRSPSVI